MVAPGRTSRDEFGRAGDVPQPRERAARSRACHPLRFSPRALVVRIGRGALDPDVAALEELALPDRRDLLHALDRVAARRERVGLDAASLRRSRRLLRRSPAGRSGDAAPAARPASASAVSAAIRSKALIAERLVGLAFQISDASPRVVVANQPEEGRDGAVRPSRRAPRAQTATISGSRASGPGPIARSGVICSVYGRARPKGKGKGQRARAEY